MTSMVIAGGTAAHAYTWATRSWYLTVFDDGSAQGRGAGTFYRSAWNQATLTTSLKDLHADGNRTFASAEAYAGAQTFFGLESNRRADGHDWWARMADEQYNKSGYLIGYTGYVKVCQDKSWAFDPCSAERSGAVTW